jgi:hypothetical protein
MYSRVGLTLSPGSSTLPAECAGAGGVKRLSN